MSNKKYTAEEKYYAVAESGKSSIQGVARQYGIGRTTLREWITKYESMGIAGLQDAEGWTRRTEAEKREAVLAYLESNQSLRDVCKNFKIRSRTQLREWIKKYNGHKKTESINCVGGSYMTKGRRVTFKEKVEIASFCIENGKNYVETMERYQVSYQQIYSWVRKYEATGVTGLEDRRGKTKMASKLSDTDRLDARIKLLEAQNRRLEMENDLLKKLEEIERPANKSQAQN